MDTNIKILWNLNKICSTLVNNTGAVVIQLLSHFWLFGPGGL